MEERQANLSRKLTRAANLLRSWVDVEVERQNRDLLASTHERVGWFWLGILVIFRFVRWLAHHVHVARGLICCDVYP